jgi:aspartyl-tRNA(Asn)/glutamyl-tRNA(Gln) amidotransferase subunit A
MSNDDLVFLSAAELSGMIARRAVSPLELMRAVLERVDRTQPSLNAFITVCEDSALATARAAEAAIMRGEAVGPLHGIPFSVKDLVNTKGVRTTYGSLIFKNNIPSIDAVAVARLKEAGAILVGKTTTPEFGQKGLTEAPLFGRTLNAWRADRTCGGSSGGAAVSVAAGMGPIAVATDGGGSTRIPAACNGVVGFKQSLGLVPHETADDAFGNISYITPMTRTVMDTALMLDAMAGPDPNDPHTLNRERDSHAQAALPEGSLAGLKVAWRPRLGNTAVSSEVMTACSDAVKALAELGAEVFEAPDDFENAEELWLTVNASYRLAQHGKHLEHHREEMDPTLVAQLERAGKFSGQELYRAIFMRTKLYRQVQGWFEEADIVITPTLARTALPITHQFFDVVEIDGKPVDTMRRAWYPYTLPFNMTGNPALSIPCGWDSDGLPIGLQLISWIGADATLLRAAALFEQARPWAQRRPAIVQGA